MGTMYDSTNAWDLPANAEAVAGYDDGDYAWPPDRWDAWAHVPSLHITVFGDPGSLCCDVESGDLSPEEGAAWAAARIEQHQPAVIYGNVSALFDPPDGAAGVVHFLELAGHPPGAHTWPDPGAYLWVADWPADPNSAGVPHLYAAPGVVATQYNHPPGSGGHYDTSTTAGFFPAEIAPPPPPAPAPPASRPGEEHNTMTVYASPGQPDYLVDGAVVIPIDQQTLDGVAAAGAAIAHISEAASKAIGAVAHRLATPEVEPPEPAEPAAP